MSYSIQICSWGSRHSTHNIATVDRLMAALSGSIDKEVYKTISEMKAPLALRKYEYTSSKLHGLREVHKATADSQDTMHGPS